MQVLHLIGLQKQGTRETNKGSKFNFSIVFIFHHNITDRLGIIHNLDSNFLIYMSHSFHRLP